MSTTDPQKEQIAGLYHRVAAAYGQVGPNIFAYAGQQLVARLGIAAGSRVLDVGAGRGALLFPAAQMQDTESPPSQPMQQAVAQAGIFPRWISIASKARLSIFETCAPLPAERRALP